MKTLSAEHRQKLSQAKLGNTAGSNIGRRTTREPEVILDNLDQTPSLATSLKCEALRTAIAKEEERLTYHKNLKAKLEKQLSFYEFLYG